MVYDVGLNLLRRICKDELRYNINNFSDLFKLSPEIEKEVALTRSEIINKYLKDAVASLNSNLYESAVISSYIGVEAVFREFIKEDIRSHLDMLNILRNRELISNELFRDLDWFGNLRNQVAHGLYKANKDDAISALKIFQRVIKEISLPLKLKCKTCGKQFESGISVSRKTFETTI